MSSDVNNVISAEHLSKAYRIFDRPENRLKQLLTSRVRPMLGLPPVNYAKEFWALRDVSLEVLRGESVAIIGRNGSGKSTLLQLVCGTLTPTEGTVNVHGRVAALLELGSGFNPDFSGRENVYLNGAILGLSKDEIDERFSSIAAFSGIGDFIDQPVKTYSSGMLVRLAFSVSVCVEPDVLVVDEALAVGDAAFQFKCLERLRRLSENGTTLLFVSHDMGMVKNFCNSAVYLAAGQERARGSPEEMAELYFMDIRDEQRAAVAGRPRVGPKPSLSGKDGMAFGTGEGAIVAARFTQSDTTHTNCLHGDQVGIVVEASYLSSVQFPAMSVLIQNHKLIEIGGSTFPLHAKTEAEGRCHASLDVRFAANLAPGRYFVTLRLESRPSETMWEPLEKQVAAMSFEVMAAATNFLGIVDLGFVLLDMDDAA